MLHIDILRIWCFVDLRFFFSIQLKGKPPSYQGTSSLEEPPLFLEESLQ